MVMRMAREYAILTRSTLGPRAYREVCRRLALSPVPGGYGALRCRDEKGQCMTLLTTDFEYLRLIIEVARGGTSAPSGIPVNGAKFPFQRDGDLAAVLPGQVLVP